VQLFRNNRAFTFSSLAALINYSATFAVTFLMSLYLQYIKGLSPQSAGTVLVVQPIVMALFSPLAGRLSDRFEPRVIASIGMALTAAGLSLFVFLGTETGLGFILLNLMQLGFGFALFSSPNMSAIMGAVDKRHYGIASGTVATMRLLGQMTSMAMATVLLAIFLGHEPIHPGNFPQFIKSVRFCFQISAVLCGVGILFSLFRGNLRSQTIAR
ncbi:MAG: MFS transporter, partial [Deltaproteobacteria bacterium]|nr:MFS transporter [Deltaproteobacteria bacterium]